MLLRNLKEKMLLPKKEILINEIVKIRGIDVHIISITNQGHRNILWTMYKPSGYNDEEIVEYTSNREEMINNITHKMNSSHIHIYEMIIQNQKMTFSSSSAGPINDMNSEGYMKLQHFIESGMVTTNWDEVAVDNLVIAAYEQNESEEFPTIDHSKKLDITLKVSKDFEELLINKPMTLEFVGTEKSSKQYFYDSIEKKDRTFYINKVEHYDIWEDFEQKLEKEWIKHFTKEQIKKMKKQYFDCLENTCPKGMSLAIVQYETEDDIQLNFYSKEFLDKEPVHNSSAAFGIIFKSDEEFGPNGLKSRVCMIKPIEKDFNGSIDVELFSWYKEIPEEIIRING